MQGRAETWEIVLKAYTESSHTSVPSLFRQELPALRQETGSLLSGKFKLKIFRSWRYMLELHESLLIAKWHGQSQSPASLLE